MPTGDQRHPWAKQQKKWSPNMHEMREKVRVGQKDHTPKNNRQFKLRFVTPVKLIPPPKRLHARYCWRKWVCPRCKFNYHNLPPHLRNKFHLFSPHRQPRSKLIKKPPQQSSQKSATKPTQPFFSKRQRMSEYVNSTQTCPSTFSSSKAPSRRNYC